jgi:hypothetical protein
MENGSSHNTVCMLQQIKEYILIWSLQSGMKHEFT